MDTIQDAAPALQANRPATLFQDLLAAFVDDPTSHQVDLAAANLSAGLATTGTACVGIIRCAEMRHLFGLAIVLADYGVAIRSKRLELHNMVLVYAETDKDTPPSEFVGAKLTVRRRRPVVLGVAA